MKEVAVGIVIQDGQVLACQRKHDAAYPLKWEFPGGKLEEGESPAAALKRELREELGIDARVEREFHRAEWTYPAHASTPNDGRFRVYYFLVRQFSGLPINHSFEQIRWVTPSELRRMDILEGNREAVEHLIGYAAAAKHRTT
jgi:8-oxo-dGTP diphosphatase